MKRYIFLLAFFVALVSYGQNEYRFGNAPSGATNLSYDPITRTVSSDTGTDAVLPLATGTDPGLLPSADKNKLDNMTISGPLDLDALAVSVAAKEDSSNKVTDLSSPDNTTYPTTLALTNELAILSLLGEESATAARNALLTDADGFVNVNSAGAVTITIEANATTAFPVGTVLTYFQEGAGDIIIAYSGGVTGDEARTFNTGHKIVLWQTATDVWQVISRPANASLTNAEYTGLSSALQNNGTAYFLTD